MRQRAVRRLQPRRIAHRHGVMVTTPRGCGTPRPARRSRSCADMSRRRVGRGLQPRRLAHRHRVGRPDRALWDAATGKEIAILRGHQAHVSPRSSAPTAPASSPPSDDNTARLWDAATGQELAVLRGHAERRESAAFSPDGTRIVTASYDKTARIWDAATGQELAILRGHEDWCGSAVFSPDGTRIVTASLDQHRAPVGRRERQGDRGPARTRATSVSSAAFSRDGSRIVTASYDMTARLWDAATAKEIAVLRGHEAEVISAAFSADGSRIVTASGDQTARSGTPPPPRRSRSCAGTRPGELGGLQPRWRAHRHRVIGRRLPHLRCRDRQGARGPARP